MGDSAASVTPISGAGKAVRAAGFEDFYELERPGLFRALALVTRNAHEAEEVSQEAFLRILERWDRVRSLEDPRGYLYRTAMNVYRSRLRRMVVGARRLSHPEPAADPYDAVEAHDEALRDLGRLTTRQRAALVFTDLLGYSFEDAGDALGIRAGTVRVLVSRARQALGEITENEDG